MTNDDNYELMKRGRIVLKDGERKTLARAQFDDDIDVLDREGEKVGDAKYLMFTKADGDVRFISIATGGLFGLGERLTAVPWDAVDYSEDSDAFVLTTRSKEEIEKSPPPEETSDENGVMDVAYEHHVRGYYFPMM